MVSVAVAAPSARFAALSVDSVNRYVLGTRRIRDAACLRVTVAMSQLYLRNEKSSIRET
jgi:hypothetical protein